MHSKCDAGDALDQFCNDVGIPEHLIADLAGEQSGPDTAWMQTVCNLRIQMQWSEKGRSNQSHCSESEIGVLQQRWTNRMTRKGIPKRLWYYGLIYEAEILSRTSRGDGDGTGIESLTGNSPDISEWLDFGFYDLLWYLDSKDRSLTDDAHKLGRWMGVSHRIGSDMCYWILTVSGHVLARTTVQHVTKDDTNDPAIKVKIDHFHQKIEERLIEHNFITDVGLRSPMPYIQDVQATDNNPRVRGKYNCRKHVRTS
jgi:hypothetical protein